MLDCVSPDMLYLFLIIQENLCKLPNVCILSFFRKKLKSTSKYIYQTLFLNGENSDIRICALGQAWNLHKVYLCQVKSTNKCLKRHFLTGSYSEHLRKKNSEQFSLVFMCSFSSSQGVSLACSGFFLSSSRGISPACSVAPGGSPI